MSVFDEFPRASFDGIEFPVTRTQVIGGLRDHVHEYPHAPGGAPEKLGRKLYTIRFSALFHNTFPTYPELYPQALSDLQDRFEDQVTSDLTIPNIGTIQAYCVNWDRTADAKARSGEAVELEFREDQSQAFLINGIVNVSGKTLQSAQTQFIQAMDPLLNPPNTPQVLINGNLVDGPPPRALTRAEALAQLTTRDADLINSILSAITSLLSIADQVELYGNLVEAKALAVVQLCESAHDSVRVFQNPVNHAALDALKQVWSTSQNIGKNATQQQGNILYYTIRITMSIGQVSTAIYGDQSRASELLQLNAIEDPFQIQKGTVLRYRATLAVALPADASPR